MPYRLGMSTALKDHLAPINDVGQFPQLELAEPVLIDEQELKTDILALWKQHDECELQIAPLLYQLCKTLHAPGKKGAGFDAWLKANGKSRSTAYRWIRQYCTEHNEQSPWPKKKKGTQAATLSHVAQTLPFVSQEVTGTQSESPAVSMQDATEPPIPPAVQVSHLNESDQISWLNIGTLAEVLKSAKELGETPAEQCRSAIQLFDPELHDYAVIGDSDYNWTAEVNSAELTKAQAHLVALKTALKALNREARQIRAMVNSVETYINRLQDTEQPMYHVVPKRSGGNKE
jgi:hypothetical protein